MDPDNVQSLLREAHVLAQHALRNGDLPAHSKVFNLIAALEGAPDPSKETALVADLYVEVEAISKAIPRESFKKLVWRRSLTSYFRDFFSVATPLALGLLTLLLTIYLAFQSSQLNQADTALRAYEDWVAQHPKEKLYAAFKMYRYERVLNVRQPPLAQLDAYQKLVEDAHELATKGEAIQQLLQNASDFRYYPPLFESSEAARAQHIKDTTSKLVELKVSDSAKSSQLGKDSIPEAPPKPQCDLEKADAVQPGSGVDIKAYTSSWGCFLFGIGIDEQKLAYSPWPVIFATKLKVNTLVTWLLPGLYGLLGACVYLMRDMMLFRYGRPTSEKNVLNDLTLVLRIALGGLAGIIIGWFWVPTSIGNGAAVQPISSIPFGAAFLAGFSIETLFSLLDRLNKSMEIRDTKKGAGASSPS